MPPERLQADNPREWLNRARGNLAQAGHAAGKDDVYWEDVCFDCQQAAEKALKGALVRVRRSFPRTHSIDELLRLLIKSGQTPSDHLKAAAGLTEYATASRYPGDQDPVTAADYQEAREWAETIIAWCAQIIEGVSE